MRKVMLFPENHIYAKADPEGFFVVEESWRSAASRYFIARRWLDWDDMAHFLARRNPRSQRFWLLGRIAANDAVRQWLWDHGYGNLYPVQIQIRNEESGRPVVSGPFAQDLRLSVAHTEGLGVALVGEGFDVGIDVEKIVPRDPDLIRTAFSNAELALLPEDDRDEWLTRLWVSKEAVGKLRGTGLAGRPRSLALSEIDGERLCVDGVWVRTRRDGEHVIGWTRRISNSTGG
jgi:phosphopantetheinyl transferase